MHRGLLVWNIILTVLLVTGFGLGFYFFKTYRDATEERILTVSQNLQELNEVVTQHAITINQHAELVNNHINNMNQEYTAALEENQKVISEMNGIIDECQQIINDNAAYLEEILGNLEALSLTITQGESQPQTNLAPSQHFSLSIKEKPARLNFAILPYSPPFQFQNPELVKARQFIYILREGEG